MKNPKFIVWHTAYHYSPSRDKTFDTTKEDLHQWHVKERGWTDIGYHKLIRWGGEVVLCRPLNKRGAHVRGLNHKSIGLCFSGSGEHEELKEDQLASGLKETKLLMEMYNIKVENVIGHNEVMKLIEAGELDGMYRTAKSCPGRFIDMDKIREALRTDKCIGCKCCKKAC